MSLPTHLHHRPTCRYSGLSTYRSSTTPSAGLNTDVFFSSLSAAYHPLLRCNVHHLHLYPVPHPRPQEPPTSRSVCDSSPGSLQIPSALIKPPCLRPLLISRSTSSHTSQPRRPHTAPPSHAPPAPRHQHHQREMNVQTPETVCKKNTGSLN